MEPASLFGGPAVEACAKGQTHLDIIYDSLCSALIEFDDPRKVSERIGDALDELRACRGTLALIEGEPVAEGAP
jgi:hypothetical protein